MRTLIPVFSLMLFCSLMVGRAHAASNISDTVSTGAVSIYYLVRHAEKQSDGTKNPHLTEQGQQRAQYLAEQLSLANITQIYSTDYHRTQETAKPLADLLGIKMQSYKPSKLKEFADTLSEHAGSILIVGHSNTTPILVNLLSGEKVDEIEDIEYDNLYQVVSINGHSHLTRLTIHPIK